VKAVFLAAGEGGRMHPLTYTRPKVMLPIANKPIIEHLLIEARKAGILEFIFIVGYHDEQVRDYFGNGEKWEVTIDYCTQKKQLGTADALKTLENLIHSNFLVMNGDMIVGQKDISNLTRKSVTTLSVIKVEDNNNLGVVELNEDRVIHIYEKMKKPLSKMANAGLYLFTPDIFDAIAQISKSLRGEYEITDSLQLLINKGLPISYQEIDYWLDLSYPWDLLSANESILVETKAQNLGEVQKNVVTNDMVFIGRNTIVRSGSYIEGPVIIGQDCDIGPNCYIRPYTSIGDNCHIGNAVEVKNCIIMKGSKIPHHNYIGDSIIGEECNFGAGTKIANLRLDKETIMIAGIDTRRHKLGAIIGDKVEMGINASINVGSMIGNNTYIGPGAIASGIISPNSRIF
jgi:bifunctional UDP-N-acetylglucosamine pyrophosphorylase/glucosamine-1-phosphate N-acetyltransferase